MASLCRRSKHFCGHCNKKLSKTLYFKHKKLYYNSRNKCWRSKRAFLCSDDVVEFNMDDNVLDSKFEDTMTCDES